MDDETLFAISLFIKTTDKILEFLDSRELFFNSEVSNLNQSFLVFNSHVYSAQPDSVFHIHWFSLIFYTIKSLSS